MFVSSASNSLHSFGLGAALVVLVFGAIGVMVTPGGIGAFTFIVAGVLINIYNVTAVNANAYGWMVWFPRLLSSYWQELFLC